MATPTSDQVHAKAVKAQTAVEDLITEVATHSPDPQTAKQLVAPLKECSKLLTEVVKVSGKTEAPAERPTIGSATDDMMAEQSAPPAEAPATPEQP